MNLKPIDRSRKPLREHNAEFVAAEVVENLMAQNAAKDELIAELQSDIEGLSADLKASEERAAW